MLDVKRGIGRYVMSDDQKNDEPSELENQAKVLRKFGDGLRKVADGIEKKGGFDKEDIDIMVSFGVTMIQLSSVTKVTK